MLSTFDTLLARPRCRNWVPLATQQLRLRHLIRVLAYNINTTEGTLYYTLHFTTMSAPFYTSEKLESQNPKWTELDVNTLQFSSATGVVLRIWQQIDGITPDKVILAWGICLSGLVYLGTKLTEIQPVSFQDNSVIFQLNGGYFTSLHCIRTDTPKPLPFKDNLNIAATKTSDQTSISRNATIKCAKNDVRLSYNVKKLQKLHSLQQSIRNKSLDAQELHEKINVKFGLVEGLVENPLREQQPTPSSTQTSTRLLSMTSLNKLLNKQQEPPTRIQRQEIARIRKLIESARFRTKLLAQERDRKLANLRHLSQKSNSLLDSNEDKNSELMSLYRQLSRDMERLRERHRSQAEIRELYVHTSAQLYLRRKQLINQLLLIYPIERVINIEENKYTIAGVHLPDSEGLHIVPEGYLSVALGYVTHVVLMCSKFLQVPLRYPMVHLGSRSKIMDHITIHIPDRDREFPLYTKGKDRLQFHYAVYLLNKNIAQLRWFCGYPTLDLRATLPNLLQLLQGTTSDYRFDRPDSGLSTSRYLSSISTDLHLESSQNMGKKYGSFTALETNNKLQMMSAKISTSCEQIYKNESTPRRGNRMSESGPGLSQILSRPEGYTPQKFTVLDRTSTPKDINNTKEENNTELSPKTDISYIENNSAIETNLKLSNCVDCNIEQGLDILDAPLSLCTAQNQHSSPDPPQNGTDPLDLALKLKRRISRSVGSYTDDEKYTLPATNLGSDPSLLTENLDSNLSDDQSLPNSFGEGRKEFLQHWFNNSPALVCSTENLCPEEFLGITSHARGDEVLAENALTSRTDALVENNSTFHLVRPKH